jgi:hypothetical protein
MTLRAAGIIVGILCITGGISLAEERSWAPCHSDLVVTGKLKPMYVIPLLDGWHIWGTLQVHEVLRGIVNGNKLGYQFLFPKLNYWPGINPFAKLRDEGIWMIVSPDHKTWTSIYPSQDGDPGYRETQLFITDIRHQLGRCQKNYGR